MSLDLPQLLPQIDAMGESAAARAARLAKLLPQAVEALDTAAGLPAEALEARLARAGDRWPGAKPTDEPLDAILPPPPHPERLNIAGADGSQIYPDRHAPLLYYLINIGTILIEQGTGSRPKTSTRPSLRYEDADLYSESDALINVPLVNGERDVAEMAALADLAESSHPAPTLALLDNGLLLWLALQVQGQQREPADRLLADYLRQIDRIQAAGAAVAGFMDRPRNASVLALLHLALLPTEHVDEANLRQNRFRGLTDRALFAQQLPPGHRSARFVHASPVNRDFRAAGHEVQFFYLNTGEDWHIARIEIPAWVGESPRLLEWVHAGILGQCKATGGFPYPLVRAHELALVSHSERQTLETMLGRAAMGRGLEARSSQKARTKRWTGARRRHRL